MACRVASAAAIPVKGSPVPPVEVGLPEWGLILAQRGWHELDGGDMAYRSKSNVVDGRRFHALDLLAPQLLRSQGVLIYYTSK